MDWVESGFMAIMLASFLVLVGALGVIVLM
jgi:hypothetical protein